jgi:hypothetical protein
LKKVKKVNFQSYFQVRAPWAEMVQKQNSPSRVLCV